MQALILGALLHWAETKLVPSKQHKMEVAVRRNLVLRVAVAVLMKRRAINPADNFAVHRSVTSERRHCNYERPWSAPKKATQSGSQSARPPKGLAYLQCHTSVIAPSA